MIVSKLGCPARYKRSTAATTQAESGMPKRERSDVGEGATIDVARPTDHATPDPARPRRADTSALAAARVCSLPAGDYTFSSTTALDAARAISSLPAGDRLRDQSPAVRVCAPALTEAQPGSLAPCATPKCEFYGSKEIGSRGDGLLYCTACQSSDAPGRPPLDIKLEAEAQQVQRIFASYPVIRDIDFDIVLSKVRMNAVGLGQWPLIIDSDLHRPSFK